MTTGNLILDLVVAVLMVGGGLFAFGAGLGLYRMDDIMLRAHAATKAGTLGVGLILLGVAVWFGEIGVVTRALAVILFMLLTAPVGAHMLARAAYRTGVRLSERTLVDEMKDRPEGRLPDGEPDLSERADERKERR